MIDTPSRTEILLSYLLIFAAVGLVTSTGATTAGDQQQPAGTGQLTTTEFVAMVNAEAAAPGYTAATPPAGTMPLAAGGAAAPATAQPIPPAAAPPEPAMQKSADTWHLNLSSFTSQAEADRFVRLALARGIGTSREYVSVNGKNYWRVFIDGFASEQEAASRAAAIRDSLGLRDVWIRKAS